MELKNAATGLGWDDAKQTVDASKEWWDEHIQVTIVLDFSFSAAMYLYLCISLLIH